MYWACAQIDANRERLALHCLQQVNGFEIYAPRIQASRLLHRRPQTGDLTRPLFPGYCFALIVLGWWAARWSPGVVRLVLDGGVPAKVPDQVIAELRGRERDGVVRLPEAPWMRPGDRVRVVRGLLTGQLGLYTGMKPHERVEVLLS